MADKIKFEKVDWQKEKQKINKETIVWEIDYANLLDKDIDERMEIYAAEGIGVDSGKKYEGSAVLIHGEFETMQDIEEI